MSHANGRAAEGGESASPACLPPASVGWIGTGVMGRSMAGHLLAAGYRVRVHTRSRERARALEDAGAEWCPSPRAAAEGAAIVCSMVGYPRDVEEVHLGPEGVFGATTPPALVIDFTTSSPSLARVLAERGAQRGIALLDAPVSGGDIGARQATLSIMVGGEPAAFAAAKPLLERLGKTIVHQGGPGTGQHAKMVNQILIAGTMVGLCEGLRYASRAGLNPESVLASVGGGAAGSWSVANLAPRILRGDFAPGFAIEHFVKDLGIALEEGARQGLDLPGLALAKRLYEAAKAAGLGRSGTHALYLYLMGHGSGTGVQASG
jgi:3-hydroxyisobutyrate dehydrogenase